MVLLHKYPDHAQAATTRAVIADSIGTLLNWSDMHFKQLYKPLFTVLALNPQYPYFMFKVD